MVRQALMSNVAGARGRVRWTQRLDPGCRLYALEDEHLVAGDFDGRLHVVEISSGSEVARIDLGAAVVGDVTVRDGVAYTVIWCTDDAPPRLVAVPLALR